MVAAFGWTLDDMEWLTLNAMKSAFLPFDGRLRIINEQVKPGYAHLRAEAAAAELRAAAEATLCVKLGTARARAIGVPSSDHDLRDR